MPPQILGKTPRTAHSPPHALVLDAVVDPVVGHLSDHLHSRWGGRHPFMYASAIPVGALYLFGWIGGMGMLLLTFAVSSHPRPGSP